MVKGVINKNFYDCYKKISLESESLYFSKNKVSNHLQFARLLISIFKTLLNPKEFYIPVAETAFDTPNLTKFQAIESVYSLVSTEKIVLISHDEKKRTSDLRDLLDRNKFKYLELRYSFCDWSLLKAFLHNLFKYRSLSFKENIIFTFETYLYLYKFYYFLTKARCKVLVTSNDDFYISPALALLCKEFGVRTINIMHGRGYFNNHFYDYSIVTGQSQVKWLENNTKSKTVFLPKSSSYLTDSNNMPRMLEDLSDERILLFFDQPPSLEYPAQTRENILRDLKRISSNPKIKIEVQPHPASTKETLRNLEKYNFMMGDISLKKYHITISACSTATIESICKYNVPSFFMNYDIILDKFSHLVFLSDFSVKSGDELDTFLNDILFSQSNYLKLSNALSEKVRNEYDSCLMINDIVKIIFQDDSKSG